MVSTATKTHLHYYTGQLAIPIIGYGTWLADNPATLEAGLRKALEVGYRHFDTAYMYGNEHIVGKVLNKWLAADTSPRRSRSDLFVTTKLPVQGCHPARVERFLKKSLENLQMSYVDLYLVHNPACVQVEPANNGTEVAFDPTTGKVLLDTSHILEEVWSVLEEQVRAGKTKAIGLSNVGISQVERIAKFGLIKPAVVQVELNVLYPKRQLRWTCAKYGIVLTAFAPLGSPGRKDAYLKGKESLIPSILDHPIVLGLGKQYGKTSAQILLKYLIQNGITVIPKSVTAERIEENFQLFGWELSGSSMVKLCKLDSGKPGSWGWDWVNAFPGLEEHPEFQQDILED